jgi:CheY-like chemotaxis protein
MDGIDRHLWDDTIGTIRPTDSRPRRAHHVVMPGRSHRQRPDSQVLVAGADADRRGRMLDELRSLLPADTEFVEAGETWEVIARAADSSMVVLAGDMGEISAAALLRMLARRHPELPVLAVGGEDRRARGGGVSAVADSAKEACRAVDAARA